MMDVTIYSTPTCRWCVTAKNFLKKKGVTFTDKNVATDAAAREEMIEKSDQMGVPVLDIGGQIIVGFDQQAIEAALAKRK